MPCNCSLPESLRSLLRLMNKLPLSQHRTKYHLHIVTPLLCSYKCFVDSVTNFIQISKDSHEIPAAKLSRFTEKLAVQGPQRQIEIDFHPPKALNRRHLLNQLLKNIWLIQEFQTIECKDQAPGGVKELQPHLLFVNLGPVSIYHLIFLYQNRSVVWTVIRN